MAGRAAAEVTLRGAGSSLTIVRPLVGGAGVLLLRGENRVMDVAIDGRGAERCVTSAAAAPGAVYHLEDMLIAGCRTGVRVTDAYLGMVGVSVRGSSDVGVLVKGGYTALQECEIADGKTGIHAAGAIFVELVDTRRIEASALYKGR